jgi:hypothetical protein
MKQEVCLYLDCQYRFSIGIPKGSDEYSVSTWGSYRNLRKTLFNVVFGLRQVTLTSKTSMYIILLYNSNKVLNLELNLVLEYIRIGSYETAVLEYILNLVVVLIY